jgi:hypothetical protein
MPATEVRSFQVLVPAGTAQDAPQQTALTMPAREVQSIEILVPPGPRGNLGFALSSGGNTIIPEQLGEWIVADGEKIVWELQDQIDSGGWELTAYNTGIYDHTVYLRFLVNLPPSQTSEPQLQAIPNAALSSG